MKLLCELFQNIQEGVHDTGKFKALVVMGGPASGKTTLGKWIQSKLPLHGTKIMDTDVMYSHIAKKHDIDISGEKTTKLANIAYKIGAHKTYKQTANWVDGMLPLILLSTGSSQERLRAQLLKLSSMGYDICVVFVYIENKELALQNEIQRAESTGRKIDVEWFNQYYQKQDDILRNVSSLYPVYTTTHFTQRDIADNEILLNSIERFFNSPVKNKIGKAVLEFLNKTGGTSLSDYPGYQDKVIQVRSFDDAHRIPNYV